MSVRLFPRSPAVSILFLHFSNSFSHALDSVLRTPAQSNFCSQRFFRGNFTPLPPAPRPSSPPPSYNCAGILCQLGRPEDERCRRESYGRPQGEHPPARTLRHVETHRCHGRGCFRGGRRHQEFQEEEEVCQWKGGEGKRERGVYLRRSLLGACVSRRAGGRVRCVARSSPQVI